MKYWTVVVLVSGLCWGRAAGQTLGAPGDSLTLDQVISRVLATHPAVQVASEGVQAASARIGQTRSGYYPNAAADLSYARIGPVPEFDIPGLGAFALYPENNYDMHVGVSQELFDFGRRSTSVDLGQAAVQAATDNVALVRTGLAFQTIQTFYSILFLQQGVNVQIQEVAALREHLDVTRRRVEGGSATEFDVSTTQVRVAAAENQRIDLETSLRNQTLALLRLMGLPADSVLRVKGGFDVSPVALAPDSLTLVALKQRNELAATRDAARTADIQYHLATLDNMPSVSMNLSYGFKNGYIPNLNVLRGNWVAGVLVAVPIFNGYRTSYKEEEAAAMQRSAVAHQTDVERTVALEVRQAVEGVRSAQDKVETSNVQVQQASDAVRIARVRYETGASTNLDLLDAETSLAQARLQQLQSLYQYTLSRFSLDRAVGSVPGTGAPSQSR